MPGLLEVAETHQARRMTNILGGEANDCIGQVCGRIVHRRRTCKPCWLKSEVGRSFSTRLFGAALRFQEPSFVIVLGQSSFVSYLAQGDWTQQH